MWKKNTTLLLLLTLTNALLAPGCATLTRKRTQRIPVTSSPEGATVIVNGAKQGVTPLELSLSRLAKSQVIRIECAGYNPYEIQLKRKHSIITDLGSTVLGAGLGVATASAWVNAHDDDVKAAFFVIPLLFGVSTILFLSVDRISKKSFEFRPTELSLTLTKADGTPRVDTMLFDAGEFRNIKWIRVHRD
jgi:hypothetical protein